MKLNTAWQHAKLSVDRVINGVKAIMNVFWNYIEEFNPLGFGESINATVNQSYKATRNGEVEFGALFTNRRLGSCEVIKLSCKNVKQLGVSLHKSPVCIMNREVIIEDLKKSAVWMQPRELMFLRCLNGYISFIISDAKAEIEIQNVSYSRSLSTNHSIKFSEKCCGSNIELLYDNRIAVRKKIEFDRCYVFLSEPLNLSCYNYLAVKILDRNNIFLGSLSFGLTWHNPSTTDVMDPVLDSKNVPFFVANVAKSDETHFTIYIWLDFNGNIVIKQNNKEQGFSLSGRIKGEFLWPIFYLDGSINKIAVSAVNSTDETVECEYVVQNMEQPQSEFSGNEVNTFSFDNVDEARKIETTDENNGNLNSAENQDLEISDKINTLQNNLATVQLGDDPVRKKLKEDCVVCFDKKINAVLVPCGHLCLCMQCGLKLFRGNINKECPICRIKINNVIQTF